MCLNRYTWPRGNLVFEFLRVLHDQNSIVYFLFSMPERDRSIQQPDITTVASCSSTESDEEGLPHNKKHGGVVDVGEE